MEYLKIYDTSNIRNAKISLDKKINLNKLCRYIGSEETLDRLIDCFPNYYKDNTYVNFWDFGKKISKIIKQNDKINIIFGRKIYNCLVIAIIGDVEGEIGDALDWTRQYGNTWENPCIIDILEIKELNNEEFISLKNNYSVKLDKNFYKIDRCTSSSVVCGNVSSKSSISSFVQGENVKFDSRYLINIWSSLVEKFTKFSELNSEIIERGYSRVFVDYLENLFEDIVFDERVKVYCSYEGDSHGGRTSFYGFVNYERVSIKDLLKGLKNTDGIVQLFFLEYYLPTVGNFWHGLYGRNHKFRFSSDIFLEYDNENNGVDLQERENVIHFIVNQEEIEIKAKSYGFCGDIVEKILILNSNNKIVKKEIILQEACSSIIEIF